MVIIKPNYTETIVNMMASIYKYYGGVPKYKTLGELDTKLLKNAKHILLVVFDGMGSCALENHLKPDDFLLKYMIKPIQSVFPPTTTAAMTSYYTGVSPLEHGWLGWSLYFKECGAAIDLFTNRNSYTGEVYPSEKLAYELLGYQSIYKQINAINPRVHIHTIKPSRIYFPSDPNTHHGIDTLEEMANVIQEINQSKEPTFTAAYWPEPDMMMHDYGPYHEKVRDKIHEINTWTESLTNNLKDTLVIVSADHGLTEIKDEINLQDYKELLDCMIMPPSLEGRAMTFWIKNHKKEDFKSCFLSHFSHDFILYTKEEILEEQLFGLFNAHPKVDDFIGDYVAIATGSRLIYYQTIKGVSPHHFKGHHAGLTEDEIKIPLIIKEC